VRQPTPALNNTFININKHNIHVKPKEKLPTKNQKAGGPRRGFRNKPELGGNRFRDTEQLMKAYRVLEPKLCEYGRIPAFGEEYTGVGKLGQSTIFNSPMTTDQIIFAMLLGGHPLVLELLEKEFGWKDFDPAPLREARVLAGMKILDLGCGIKPLFARVARKLGADVYTVDVIPADCFPDYFLSHSKKDKQDEIAKHIQLDLNGDGAVEEIKKRSGGGFDLVTESQLHLGASWDKFGGRVTCNYGKPIAMQLLKTGGYHFHAAGRLSRATKLE